MTDAPTLTIATPFNDVSELTDNFATRVDEAQIMLPYGEPVDAGLALQFVVLLLDGSVAFEGSGVSTGSHDNGEDFPPEYRYDVVLESLQLSGMSEVMFERFLQARQSQMEGDPGTGEVDVNQLGDAGSAPVDDAADAAAHEEAPSDLPTEARPIEASAPMEAVEALDAGADEMPSEDWQPEGEFAEQIPTQAVHVDEIAQRAVPSSPPPSPVRSAPPPAVPSAPPPAAARPAPPAARPSPPQRPRGSLPAMHTFDQGILTRPSASAGWAPEVVARPEAAQSSGLFDYQGGLPRPASPPRPEMPDEQRVAAAPSPSAPWSTAAGSA